MQLHGCTLYSFHKINTMFDRLAQTMQDRYEKEVMLHGADLQAMSAMKANFSSHQAQLESLTVAKTKAEEILEGT